MSERRDH